MIASKFLVPRRRKSDLRPLRVYLLQHRSLLGSFLSRIVFFPEIRCDFRAQLLGAPNESLLTLKSQRPARYSPCRISFQSLFVALH